jgi:hypothetical protein
MRRVRGSWATITIAAVLAATLASADGLSAAPAAETYVRQAVAFYNSGQCERAIGLLNKAIAADPRYVRAYSWLGFCYAKLGRNQDAITAFKRVVTLAPKSDDARVAKQWIARLAQPAPKPTPAPPVVPAQTAAPTGVVPLAALVPVVGITEANLPQRVQLFGEVYRRALVDRRNWWQGRRPGEREWRVVYNLQRRYARFRAKAGVEDGLPQEFTAIFEVRADGNTLFVGKPKRSGDVPDVLDLDVTGALQLELIVRGRDPVHTRDLSVVWGDPVVDSRPSAIPASPPAAPAPTNSPAPSTSPAPPGGSLPQNAPRAGASPTDIMEARCALCRTLPA